MIVGARRRAARWAALLFLGALLAAGGAARAEIIEEIVAFVNGEILSRSDLREREAQIRIQLGQQFAGEDLEVRMIDVRKNILTDMVRELLLIQRAEILGLDLDRVYKSALDNLKDQQGIKTNDEMRGLLRQEGITEEEMRKILLRYNIPDIMINLEVRQKILVLDEEVETYFKEHQSEFRVAETYKFREIVILAEGHEEGELEEIASKFQADLDQGLPFSEMVLKYSEAPSRFQEGIVGPLEAPDLSDVIRDALRPLKGGEIVGPIRTPHGLHFMQLEARTEAKEPVLEDVRRGIENKVKQEKFAGELEDYWEMLYRENRIDIPTLYRAYASGIPRK
jgi:parvulin-like peptidyl-prolyl isomerase